MKLYLLFFIIGALQVSATVYSQNDKLNVKVKDVAISELLWQLQQNSEFVFVYKTNDLKDAEKISLSKTDASLAEILDEALADSNLTYELDNGVVVIKQKLPVKVRTTESEIIQPQKIKVSGTVKDDKGEPIPFAALRIKGTDRGTVTDINGHFELEVDEVEGVVLEVSSIGFKNVELDLNGKTDHKIVLKADNVGLNEVVAIGYGSSRRKDLTGSVASVNQDRLSVAASGTSIDAILQGAAAGVNVTTGSGPGAPVRVRIRGASSLDGNQEPLYIVDGVRIPTEVMNLGAPSSSSGSIGRVEDQLNAMLNISMDDVESIDILKDASAAAIYGTRASNGVVIITTKKGKKGSRGKFTYQGNFSFQSSIDKVKMMNTNEYVDFLEAAIARTEAIGGGINDKYLQESLYDRTIETDWLDEVSQKDITQEHILSLRGGHNTGGYFASINYLDNQGVIVGSSLKRLSGRFNFDSQINDFMRIDLGMSVSNSNNKKSAGAAGSAMGYRPNAPIYDDEGNYFYTKDDGDSPVVKTKIKQDFETFSFQGNFGLEFKILPFLTFTTRPSINYTIGFQHKFFPSFSYQGGQTQSGQQYKGAVSEAYTKNSIQNIDNILRFNKSFSNHNFMTILGQSYEKSKSYYLSAEGKDVADDYKASNINTASTLVAPNDFASESAILSYFFRNEYNYNNKYYFNFSLRRDGSSKFGSNNRFAYFPAFGAAWTLSEENWYKNLGLPGVIDYFKLRATYGEVGNQNINSSLQYTTYKGTSYNETAAFVIRNLANTTLQWERTKEFDYGVRLSLFDNLFGIGFSYYNRTTDNLLYGAEVAPSLAAPYGEVTKNIAEVENKGIEFELEANIINSNDVTFRVGFNISQNRNKVLKLSSDDDIELQGYTIMEPGHTNGTFWGFVSDGIIQSQDEIDALNATTYIMTNGSKEYFDGQYKGPGDLKYLDINKDGIINNDDKTYLGSSEPDFFGGLYPSFRYKNFTLAANFTFNVGGIKFWYAEYSAIQIYGVSNKPAYIKDAWTEDNRNAHYPRMLIDNIGKSARFSDYFLHDASYLKLNDLRLQYRMNTKKWFKNGLIESIQLSSNITNLFTITNYPGFDPSAAGGSNSWSSGVDYDVYPPVRTLVFGVKAVF